MEAELHARVRRIYAALDETIEHDLSEFVAKPTTSGLGFDEFRGNLSDEQISNLAHSAIHNVANLRDHMKRLCRKQGKDPKVVDDAVQGSRALKLVLDLSNNDKHGYPPRNGGRTGKAPLLKRACRAMQLKASADEPVSSVVFKLDGSPPEIESGTPHVIITGEIIDRKKRPLADLHETLLKAVGAWEDLLGRFGPQLK